MDFTRPLQPGTLLRRYKRFLADVMLDLAPVVVSSLDDQPAAAAGGGADLTVNCGDLLSGPLWPAETAARLGERLMNGRVFRQTPLALPAGVTMLRDLSDASPYADFWRRLSQEDRLLADRSPEILRWRLADPDLTLPPVMLACVKDSRIVGMAMAQMTKTSLIEPPYLDIVDLIALETAPEAIGLLTKALINNARALGAAKVRLQVVTPRLLAQLGDLAKTARREGGWGHCHAIIDDPALAATWTPTPFDGDYGICWRTPPMPKSLAAAAITRPTLGGRVSKA